MRVEMINPRTGGKTLVHESRVAEYEAMGYTLASSVIADVKPVEITTSATVKKATKRSAKR